ncbi:MAG: DUF1127 domain-containing protein [Pseudomonadota bacterium]
MAYATASTNTRSDLFGRIGATVSEARDAWARYSMYRSTLNELMDLSDRELADLGVSRFNITAVAHEAAYGK